MTDDVRFERSTRDWLELGPIEAPVDVIQAALLEIDTTPQERDLRIPWRFETMPTFARALLAAVLIVGVAVSGVLILQQTKPPEVAAPSVHPPIDITPTGPPSPPASSVALALTDTFRSPTYGFSLSVSPDWVVTPATLTWTGPDNTGVVDDISFPDGGGITAASEGLRPGQTWDEWLDLFAPPSLIEQPCSGGPPDTWAPIQIGHEPGRWQQMCGDHGEAIVQFGRRAYVFTFGAGTGRDPVTLAQFEEQILPTVQFDPASVVPPPAPPPLSDTFRSDRHGYSLSYPRGFAAEQATKSVADVNMAPGSQAVDTISSDAARLIVWSAALEPGHTVDEWTKEFCAARRNQWTQPCDGAPANWRDVPLASGTAHLMVDGESVGTYVHDESRLFMATATKGDRVYVIQMDGLLNENLFLEILASMRLDPASAPI